jgi:hypothetical protein
MSIEIVSTPISRQRLQEIAEERYGDMVKGVVDVERRILALGAELHADEEKALIESGSQQIHLWGINIFPQLSNDEWIEFDSLINVRPKQNNRTRSVESLEIRSKIVHIVQQLIV